MKSGKHIEIKRDKNCIAVRVSENEVKIEHMIPMRDVPALIEELRKAHEDWQKEPMPKSGMWGDKP